MGLDISFLKNTWEFLQFNKFHQGVWKSLNRQNGFRKSLKRLSCHKDFKTTQAQTKVSFFI